MKKVLILGAGMVAKPMATYFLERNIGVVVASRTLSKAESLVAGYLNGKAIKWTVDEEDVLRSLVEEADCVVSLLPYTYHVKVAKICIEKETNLVTTSYLSEEMQNLNEKALKKGVLLLNEIGLDPGIDHLSAQKTVDHIHSKGGNVIAFHSYCGSLPAPEYSDNPFGYKIGWSPKGVALAARNSALYLKDGKEVKILPEDLFGHYFKLDIEGIGKMEIYPNRDSVKYLEKYGIPEAKEIFRGTIRYPSWCDLWLTISQLGLLGTVERDLSGFTYRGFIKDLINSKTDDLRRGIREYVDFDVPEEVLDKLEWIGLFSDKEIPIKQGGNIDVLVERMKEKLAYKDGEKDIVILQDEVVGEIEDKKEIFISKLIDFGTVGEDTAIARTVSLPAACAVDLMLKGEIREKGVLIPTKPAIYEPVLEELENVGIKLEEKVEPVGKEFGLNAKDFKTALRDR
ncbi:MAG: saccharopine dehydrogenase C-terminal domain-containing protein [candidate division WOR-3 bacterium]|nr:saccharopine dehydrogenase C-terminal domain-containing protein [candidate division WOR-3 bacterium]